MKDLIVPPSLPSTAPDGRFPQRQLLDVDALQSTIQRALGSRTLRAKGVGIGDISKTIDEALSAAGLNPQSHKVPGASVGQMAVSMFRLRDGSAAPNIAQEESATQGEFVRRSFTCRAGTRAYKLYIPSTHAAQAERAPLVVMLHGCTQSADDFAAGTRMNALAETQGFLVAYPEQAANANGSHCWNWFRKADQQRDGGEPSLIAGITREIASAWRIDERRVYVAGLSAGGAMAIVLGATYPELYAAVGAHSGLAYGSAHDVPSAFAAMKGNSAADSAARYRENLVRQGINALPTVVFHGDSDQTVAVANASIIVDQAIAAMANQAQLLVVREEGMTAGRSYSRTAYAVESDPPLFEHWTIRGAGHAWSGGSVNGSFTDIRGPDASAEMIKFFQTHAR